MGLAFETLAADPLGLRRPLSRSHVPLLQVVGVKVMTSTTVSGTLDTLREWFCTNGIPEQLVTDNGPQFTADAFKEFTQLNGIRHIKSAPYYPALNRLAERLIQLLKQSLKASLIDG